MSNRGVKRAYLIFTVVFGFVFLLTLAYSFFSEPEIFHEDDCIKLEITVTRMYNNKSVDIRIETAEFEAVFTVPPSIDMTKLMNAVRVEPNGKTANVAFTIYIDRNEAEFLNEKPRKALKARQLVYEDKSDGKNSVTMSFDVRNDISSNNFLGINILINSFSGLALAVCAYHTIRVQKLIDGQKKEDHNNNEQLTISSEQ